jgi:UDP-3-O-[3-hydroxymyristoyl] glucosamine N-acyltransferase
MIVYPVPVEVTQARIQLLIDQTAKAPPNKINEDLRAVYDAKSQAVQAQIEQHAQIGKQAQVGTQTPVERQAPVEKPTPAEPAALVDVKA